MQSQFLKRMAGVASAAALILSVGLPPAAAEQHQEHQGHQGHNRDAMDAPATNAQTLPPVPTDMPGWMDNKDKNHIYRKRGSYNDDIYNIRPLALDLNAVAVGHALAYEDLVTGKAQDLETKTFEQIDSVLKNPPRFMPDEANISATFGRKYGVLEQVFDWTHILHAQTVDVLASTELTDQEKEAEIERLYQFYVENVPYAITGLPMHMGYLDSQPYSKAFRREYPKVNGLFWGYHWLQGTMYDTLYGKTLEEQQAAYAEVGKRYHEVELYRTDRTFMPMFAEVSPRFAARFPYISNTFDNLHMLHDLVNDILASDWMTEEQQEEQIKRAIWMVMAANHEGMKPGENYGANGLHDHRFMEGLPGMGLMTGIEGAHGTDHGQGSHSTDPADPNPMQHDMTQPDTMNHDMMQHDMTQPGTVNHDMMQHDTTQPEVVEPSTTAPNTEKAPAGSHSGH